MDESLLLLMLLHGGVMERALTLRETIYLKSRA
jgi:hypothetical protein